MTQKNKSKATHVIDTMTDVGDQLSVIWDKTQDLKVIQTAIQAYNTSISAAKATVVYKKLTGNPSRIGFFEGDNNG